MDVSIVMPVFNEKESIDRLYGEICAAMAPLNRSFEIIFVDDGSDDGSLEVLQGLIQKAKQGNINLLCLALRKNFGKSEALQTGFKTAKGEVIITLDGDLQDDPGEIPKFLDKIDEGYDMVSGWKFNRKDPIDKSIPSKIFNFITSKLMKTKIHDINCGFKAYRRKVIDELTVYGELHRYIPVLVSNSGFKIAEIKVNHRPRLYGKSKYGIGRVFAAHDLITIIFLTKYLNKPLHFIGNFGLLFSFSGFSIIFFLYMRKFLIGIPIGNNQFLFLVGILLAVVGIQFFCIGLLGELIIRVVPGETRKGHIGRIFST